MIRAPQSPPDLDGSTPFILQVSMVEAMLAATVGASVERHDPCFIRRAAGGKLRTAARRRSEPVLGTGDRLRRRGAAREDDNMAQASNAVRWARSETVACSLSASACKAVGRPKGNEAHVPLWFWRITVASNTHTVSNRNRVIACVRKWR